MSVSSIAFKSKKLLLEGMLSIPDDIPSPYPGIVVCHSHPSFRGNMNEQVVSSICQLANSEGFATLRFNFRGTGGSEGHYDGGKGETKDVKSAVNMMKKWPGLDKERITVVGYSFGALVIMDGVKGLGSASKFVLVSPPPNSASSSRLNKDKRPLLVVSGEKDRLSPPIKLNEVFSEYKYDPRIEIVAGADFSLTGHHVKVARIIVEFAGS